ncbi:putative epidermal cell surface receptor isoform X1 [Schistocerca americana]|uniref:putative epidermal cell surface receptor isoform X1 n=1 Tax=Schistocerca americana TaxID=7009 RepID=UPI001F4F3B14|nr:putative epidermal cell surface receptor isoform X1 [Schistocerca americana]
MSRAAALLLQLLLGCAALATTGVMAQALVPGVLPAETPPPSPPSTPPPLTPPPSQSTSPDASPSDSMTTTTTTSAVTTTTAGAIASSTEAPTSRDPGAGRALGAGAGVNMSDASAANMTTSLQDLSLDDIDTSMLTTTVTATATAVGECPPGGGNFSRGCEETCECAPGSSTPSCRPRCAGPMFRRGRARLAADPLCDEKPVDDCCAVLVCQDSAVEPLEICQYENITLQRGEVYKNGCEEVCTCGEAGKLNCKPRCPSPVHRESAVTDKCVMLPDPTDPCCKVLRCDVTLTEGDYETSSVSAQDSTSANLPMNTTTPVTTNFTGTCQYKGNNYEINEEFHDGCEAFCICEATGVQCAPIQCPTEFGLDLIDPHCLEWDTSAFVPSPPSCCPSEAICKNNGSCLYEGQRFDNFAQIPTNLTGCEQHCACEFGNVTCRRVCEPLGDSPPPEFNCPVPPIIGLLPHDNCCRSWLCPQPSTGTDTMDRLLGTEHRHHQLDNSSHVSPDSKLVYHPSLSQSPSQDLTSVTTQEGTQSSVSMPMEHFQENISEQKPHVFQGPFAPDHLSQPPMMATRNKSHDVLEYIPKSPVLPLQETDLVDHRHNDFISHMTSNAKQLGSAMDGGQLDLDDHTSNSFLPTVTYGKHETNILNNISVKNSTGLTKPDTTDSKAGMTSTGLPGTDLLLKELDAGQKNLTQPGPVSKINDSKPKVSEQIYITPAPSHGASRPVVKNPEHNDFKIKHLGFPQIPTEFHPPEQYPGSLEEQLIRELQQQGLLPPGAKVQVSHNPVHPQEVFYHVPGTTSNGAGSHEIFLQNPDIIDPHHSQNFAQSPPYIPDKIPAPQKALLPHTFHGEWLSSSNPQGFNDVVIPNTASQQTIPKGARERDALPNTAPDSNRFPNDKLAYINLAQKSQSSSADIMSEHDILGKKSTGQKPFQPNPLQIPEDFLYHIQQHAAPQAPLYNSQQGTMVSPHSHPRGPPTTPEELLARLHQQGLLSDPRNHSGFGIDNLPPGFPRLPSQKTGDITVHIVEAVDPTSVRLVFSVPPVLVGLHGRIELRYTSDKGNNDVASWEQQILAPPDDIIATPQLEFVLGELQPDTEYQIQISVMMRDIQNAPHSPVISVRTPPALPPIIEIDPALAVVELNGTWVDLSWRRFSEEEAQFIDGIQLRYKEVNDKVYTATPLIHRSVTKYRLENLRPSSQYEIAIFFIPFHGQTTELQAREGLLVSTTALHDPYFFELKVDVSQLKATSVEIQWDGVPYPPDKYVNVFRAIYQSDAGKEDFSTFKIVKRDAPPKAIIQDLKPGTRYRLWLEAYLTNGKIKKSNVKDFMTKPASVAPEGNSIQGKLEGAPVTPVQTANSYYSPLVAVAILAAISTLAAVILLLVLLRKHGQNKAAISAGRKSQSAYDNPSYKTCDSTGPTTNGNSVTRSEAP